MATNKSRAPRNPKQPTQNTSAAPVPGNSADATATGAAQAVSKTNASGAGQSPREETRCVPPEGDKKSSEPVATELIVTSKVEGFRRAGRPWSRESQTVSVGDFSQYQIEALLAEPMLEIVVVVSGNNLPVAKK